MNEISDLETEKNITIEKTKEKTMEKTTTSTEILQKIIKYTQNFIEKKSDINVSHYNRFYFDKKFLFYKKSEAYDCSNRYGRLPVFSIDISDKEAKKAYIVTGYQYWWKEYKSIKPEQRYAYEVVLPEMPCHLYVDVEAEFSNNNSQLKLTINDKFALLIKELRQFMYIMHLAPTEYLDNIETIILDSSKPTKFSKHCIFKIPFTLFENNYYCGAFIRRFQIHILTKYGNKDTNPFFNYPENQSKQTSEFKLFLIDMGVYTKGRDFRLLGSYKRANGGIGVPKRFLWLENKPDVLSYVDFFNTLIQFQPKPKRIKIYIAHIVDTINGGIPQSSSLRTVMPIVSNYNEYNATGNSIVRFLASNDVKNNNDTKKTCLVPLKKEIIDMVIRILETTLKTPITNVQMRGSSVFFSTSSHMCRIKSEILKEKNAYHTKNVIFYILFGTTGVLSQSCFNTSYCFDISNNRHRVFKLGTIRNSEIIQGLIEWCKNNDWDWHGDSDFIIPNKWLGSD